MQTYIPGPKQSTKKKLTTLTFVITNGSNSRQTATLFGSNLEPLIQPLGISVVIQEIENHVFNSHNYLRRDILSNKLKIVGFTYFVQNPQQFNNSLQFGTIKPFGRVEINPFTPSKFISQNQIATNIMEVSQKINWDVDGRSILYVPVEAKSSVTLLFTVLEDIDEPFISEYQSGGNKKRQIQYDSDEIKNINSQYDINFDGNNDYPVFNNNNNPVIGLLKFGIVAIGTGLIINAIIKSK